jgi:hypothetical protein
MKSHEEADGTLVVTHDTTVVSKWLELGPQRR